MSKTITHEGKEYILKSEVDNIVSSRISKVSESRRATEAELEKIRASYHDMSERIKGVDALHSQIATLQEELTNSNQRYNRHSAIASHGITNPEVRDLVEYQYKKTMEGMNKKDRVTLGEWLGSMQDPQNIPHVLKPFMGQTQSAPQSAPQATPQSPQPRAAMAPVTNAHVQPVANHNTSKDMMTKATTDFEYYRKNREEIKRMYYAKKGKVL